MSDFNPGPWNFYSDMHGHPYITNEDGGVVAWIAPDTCYQAFDTSCLIAAAPDLLEGLKALYKAYVNTLEAGRDRIISLGGTCDPVDQMEQGDHALVRARQLIAKAQGHAHE